MSNIQIYTTRTCGYCYRAKQLLQRKGLVFQEIAVDGDRKARADLLRRTSSPTVPQIWIGEHYVGGCDELHELDRRGELDALVQAS